MAPLAQEWRTELEQRRDVGTMRAMADGAIFGYGLMLKQVWAAFFGMAGVAGFYNRVFPEQFWAGRTMRVVAIRAHYLAFADGVMRGFLALGPLLLVAGKADFWLRPLVTNPVLLGVVFVAGCAGYIVDVVGAAVPVRAFGILGVAGEAGSVLFLRAARRESAGGATLGSEKNVGLGTRIGVCGVLDVGFALAVTRLTAGRTGISPDAMLGRIDGKHRFFFILVMAPGTYRIPCERGFHGWDCRFGLGSRAQFRKIVRTGVCRERGRDGQHSADKHSSGHHSF